MAERVLKKDFESIVSSLLEDLRSGQGGRTALTDDTEGSVVRTLVEAFGRELAVCYAQLDQVYRLGYLDTADGAALDNVVALLGVTRRRGGFLQGTVTFTRKQAAPEEVPIPAGTAVAGKGVPAFATTRFASIPRGGMEVTVPIRSVERVVKAIDPAKLGPAALTLMPRPLLGIDGLANRVQLIPEQEDETDAELRERARQEVGRAKLGTVDALRLALGSLGLSQVNVQEPPERPGLVEVVVGDPPFDEDDALRAEAERVVQESRPAGVHVDLHGTRWVWIRVEAVVEMRQAYPASEQRALEAELRWNIAQYLEGLGIGDDVREAKIRGLLAGHEKVQEVYATPRGNGSLLDVSVGGEQPADTAKRRSAHGEVEVRADERARLARDGGEAIVLQLVPPRPPAFVDVELQLAGTVADAELLLRAALREYLGNLVSQGAQGDVTLAFDDLEGALPQELKNALRGVRFTVIHTANGQAMVLGRSGDLDVVKAREQLQLRGVQILGGGA